MSEDSIESFDDGAIVIYKTRFGLYEARQKDGKALCCSINKEDALFWAREHLNGFQLSECYYPKINNYGEALK